MFSTIATLTTCAMGLELKVSANPQGYKGYNGDELPKPLSKRYAGIYGPGKQLGATRVGEELVTKGPAQANQNCAPWMENVGLGPVRVMPAAGSSSPKSHRSTGSAQSSSTRTAEWTNLVRGADYRHPNPKEHQMPYSRIVQHDYWSGGAHRGAHGSAPLGPSKSAKVHDTYAANKAAAEAAAASKSRTNAANAEFVLRWQKQQQTQTQTTGPARTTRPPVVPLRSTATGPTPVVPRGQRRAVQCGLRRYGP